MKFKLTIGDYWDDGHGKYENFLFDIEATKEEVEAAIDRAENKLGFMFTNLCCEYEDNTISEEQNASFQGYFGEEAWAQVQHGEKYLIPEDLANIVKEILVKELGTSVKEIADRYTPITFARPPSFRCSTRADQIGYGLFW